MIRKIILIHQSHESLLSLSKGQTKIESGLRGIRPDATIPGRSIIFCIPKAEGNLLFSWGKLGTGEGQFNIAHNVCTDRDGWVYVADRENQRIQVFDKNGKFETQWKNMARPCGLYIDQSGDQKFYVGELGSFIAPHGVCINSRGDIFIGEARGPTPAAT